MHDLIARCPPLDSNSLYCNLLQCDVWSATSILAFLGEELVGSVTGFMHPKHPETLFVWQVAVAPNHRGHKLGVRMLRELLSRLKGSARYVETTITPGNLSSEVTFGKVAQAFSAAMTPSHKYESQTHFGGNNASETLWRIGPLSFKGVNNNVDLWRS